eukprot:11287750-Alexandrium_andersonii.AAC.1
MDQLLTLPALPPQVLGDRAASSSFLGQSVRNTVPNKDTGGHAARKHLAGRGMGFGPLKPTD